MKKKIIIYGIALVIIIIGIIMVCTLGFNLDFDYGEYTKLNVYMNQTSNLDDVKQIVEEVFDGKYKVEYTDNFEATVAIKARGISDEQLQEIKDKLNEKYQFEDISENTKVINVPGMKVFDLVKDYITPIIISFVILMIYFAIAFRKLGLYKSLIEPIIEIILIGGIYVSIIAICRIPVNAYIIPLGIFIYIVAILGITAYLNKKTKEITFEKK